MPEGEGLSPPPPYSKSKLKIKESPMLEKIKTFFIQLPAKDKYLFGVSAMILINYELAIVLSCFTVVYFLHKLTEHLMETESL
jgi:hypothetical protein